MWNNSRVLSARAARRGLLVAAMCVGMGVGVATPAPAGTSSPQQVLKRVNKFLDGARSIEFTATIGPVGDDAGTLEQAAVFPNRGRAVLTLGGDVIETTFIKDQAYILDRTPGRSVEGFPSIPQYGHPDEYLVLERPQDVTELPSLLTDVEIVSEEPDGTVVRGTFKEPGDVFRVGPNPYTAAHVDFTVKANGEPTAFTLVASGPDGEVHATVDAITWNEPVTVRAPKKADRLDTDGVAQFSDAPLYQPKALPRGWKLDTALVLDPVQTLEGCAQIETVYANPKNLAEGVDIFEFPTACANPDALQGGEPLTLGSYQGTIVAPGFGFVQAQFDVNGTTIQVAASLTREEFEQVFSELEPLDFDKPPKANLQVS